MEVVVSATSLPRRDCLYDGKDDDQDIHDHVPSSSASSITMISSPSSNSEDSSLPIVMACDDDHSHDDSSGSPRIEGGGENHEPKSKKLRKKSLGSDYQPGEHAVVCGRGKEYSLSTGNCFLRCLVNHCLVPYSNASTKAEKSRIVTAIIKAVHSLPTGIFIRFEKSQWWEVDDAFARDKVSESRTVTCCLAD